MVGFEVSAGAQPGSSGTASIAIRCLCCALLFIGATGCAEPFIVLPGKALAGTLTQPPPDWSGYESLDVVQLETRIDDPYSINVWCAAIGSGFYVATGEEGTRWTELLATDPRVRLRIDTSIYELRAVRVLDPAEIGLVAEQYVAKYGLDAEDNWVEKALVYRLDRR